MRFDSRLVSLATYFGVLLFNAFTLLLYLEGQLTLYIHPRYVLFTVVLTIASVVVCGIGFVITAWRVASGSVGDRVPWRPSFAFVVAGLVLVAAYALPARTLSSNTADQRSGNFNSAGMGTGAPGSGDTLALFGSDTSRLGIEDWVAAFNLNATPDLYAGKDVDLVGFVFHPDGAPEDVFYVARFRVTCCAVDAQPLGVPVRAPGWQERFETDSWVRVAGGFTDSKGAVAEPVVVDPKRMEPTEQPKNPYVT